MLLTQTEILELLLKSLELTPIGVDVIRLAMLRDQEAGLQHDSIVLKWLLEIDDPALDSDLSKEMNEQKQKLKALLERTI